MTKQTRLSPTKLRELYRDDYVSRYHSVDTGRIENILNNVNVSEHDSVIDIGCGNGLLLKHLEPRPKLYRGVDFSEEFIFEAKHRHQDMKGDIEFICQDIISFCQQHPNTFDWAFALDFSEHIYDEQFLEIFSAIATTLHPNGKLVLHTPNAEFVLERLKARNCILKQFPEHVAVRNDLAYYGLLSRAQFQHIHVSFLPHYNPFLRLLAPFQDLPILRKYLRARLLIIAQPGK